MSTARQRERQLRRQCRTLLRELDIRPPLDVFQLCERLGEQRGKPIRLLAHPIPVPGPSGAWIATGDTDYILYQQETTKAHQHHIILHELGHMLAGHAGDTHHNIGHKGPEHNDQILADAYPDLSPESVRRALRRTAYDAEPEHEAELVATIILEWASVLDRVAPRPLGDISVDRYNGALVDRVGWL